LILLENYFNHQKRMNKQTLYRKIFAKNRRYRWLSASKALEIIDPSNSSEFLLKLAVDYLNHAAPVAINMGNGWIECNSFGTINNDLIPYRPRDRRKDCTALVAGIRLSAIKKIKLI
jgi:hypothetical protein